MAKPRKKSGVRKPRKSNVPDLSKERAKALGQPPGTPVYVGEPRSGSVTISCINYSRDVFEEKDNLSPNACKSYINRPEVTWININGIHDAEAIARMGEIFNLHPLMVEDILNTQQRPKIEDYGESIFIVLKMLEYDETAKDIQFEQMSIVLCKDYILTFQERPGDVFDTIRNRIRTGKGRARTMGTDYLAYSLIDAIVDNYYILLEKIGEDIETIEEELVEKPGPETLQKIYFLKREMIILRKSIWPMREIIAGMERMESDIISAETCTYLRNVYEHTIQAVEMVETYRDMLSGMLDLYLSSISNRMNEVMKVLTIISTIFIPLTFIAGVYGMNFDPDAGPLSMPELNWPFGYMLIISLMLVMAIGMVFYFRKHRWI